MISNRLLAWVLIFSVLAVWSHWNVLSIGMYALGLNATLFWLGVLVILFAVDAMYSLKRVWVWLFPVFLIALSYSLYENPWLKLISLLLLPIIVGVFCTYSRLRDPNTLIWNSKLLGVFAIRLFRPIDEIGKVVKEVFDRSVLHTNDAHKGTLARVLRGVALLVPLSVVVLMLLSSADAVFGEIVVEGVRTALKAMSWLVMLKLNLSALLTIGLLSMAKGWSGIVDYEESPDVKEVDGLVAGIVLGGLLFIYGAFLYLQLDNLVIETLPENYREAERMVKSGFWQLFVLAVINTGLFFIVYRKTAWLAQCALRLFIIASSLLMISAAWKVVFYSYTFGLSYEKFFACYTAVFALGVLIYLVAASFSRNRRNVVKAIAFAALWGYAVATISPVERIIFHANLHFAQQSSTRINLSQLTQLSLDVMEDVDAIYSTRLAVSADDQQLWRSWRWRQKNEYCKRAWYEANFSVIKGCR